MGRVRIMLKEKNFTLALWGEHINTCVNVLNRSSKKIFQGETPNEKWNGKKPKIDHLMGFLAQLCT